MKRAEKIAMLLRTREGVPIKALAQSEQTREFRCARLPATVKQQLRFNASGKVSR